MEIKIFSLEPDGECPEPYNNSNGTYEYRYRYFPGEPSVLDPNTSNLVPDPEFWPNLDLDPETYVYMCGSWSVFGIRIQIRIHNTGYDYLVLVCLPQAMVSAFTALAQPCRDLLLVRMLNLSFFSPTVFMARNRILLFHPQRRCVHNFVSAQLPDFPPPNANHWWRSDHSDRADCLFLFA